VTTDADAGLALVAEYLEGQGGPPLCQYKDRCLRRRLAVRMRACGVDDLMAYAEVLRASPDETRRLLGTLTINVSECFRNPEVWERLEALLVPLVTGRRGAIRAWSAGCAAGEEPYSLALLLDLVSRETLGAAPLPALVDATDIDPESLARARRGRYPARVRGRHRAAAGFGKEGDVVLVPEAIRSRVDVAAHDLLRDPPPHPPYDLILCRNVLIYFERPAQEVLFTTFADALHPGGLLVLGRVESVLGPARERFELLYARERIYRRAA